MNRNEACPCGSGRKYKKCCIDKFLNPQDLWKERALALGIHRAENEKFVDIFFAVFNYSQKKGWRGACHSVSSLLFILLKESGFDCNLKLGFVKAPLLSFPFTHSWITVKNEVFDIGLYRANPVTETSQFIEVSAPVFQGINLKNNEETRVMFDVSFSQGASDRIYQQLSKMTFSEYMEGWQYHKEGLWGEAVEIGKELNLNLFIPELKEKYGDKLYSQS